MNICKLAAIAGLERFGTYDYAVPYDWLMQNPEKNRPHYWWYSRKRRSVFGRPLAWRTVARMALWKMRRETSPDIMDFLHAWAIVHPGKELDAFGRTLIARHIEAEVERWGDKLHLSLVLVNLRYCFQGAGVPIPDFARESPEENRQAA